MEGSGHLHTLASLPPVALDVLKKRKHYLPHPDSKSRSSSS